MSEYRNSYEIKRDILNVCIKSTTKTGIVYGANLNFKIVKKYIDELESKGLLKRFKEDKKTLYRTTEYAFIEIIPLANQLMNMF